MLWNNIIYFFEYFFFAAFPPTFLCLVDGQTTSIDWCVVSLPSGMNIVLSLHVFRLEFRLSFSVLFHSLGMTWTMIVRLSLCLSNGLFIASSDSFYQVIGFICKSFFLFLDRRSFVDMKPVCHSLYTTISPNHPLQAYCLRKLKHASIKY